MNALAQLDHAVNFGLEELTRLRISGVVTEVTPSYYRLAGLSPFLKLGECVGIKHAGTTQLSEVVRIDADGRDGQNLRGAGRRRPRRLRLSNRTAACGARCELERPRHRCAEPADRFLRASAARRTCAADRIAASSALRRARVKSPVKTGVRVIDLFMPICAGQRIGIFAGSGVGKSTLLGMIAGSKGFDSVVIALVGERGREVREFIDDSLGANRNVAVTVVATGDESPMMRRLAPKTALTIAEFFRDRGEKVLLIIDSVTRFAHAARDVALAAGEPAVARGYAPSVFSDLPKLLERAGPGAQGSGSITGIFSVLVDGDDHNDPVADNIRGTLDGHIVLDRAIADQGRFPAVNILTSISRLAQHVWTKEQQVLILKLKAMIARYEETRDLRLMGGYQPGQDADLDQAVALVPKLYDAVVQAPTAPMSRDAFHELAEALQAK